MGKKHCNVEMFYEYMTLKIQVQYVNEFEASYNKDKEEVVVVVGHRDQIPSGKATFNKSLSSFNTSLLPMVR